MGLKGNNSAEKPPQGNSKANWNKAKPQSEISQHNMNIMNTSRVVDSSSRKRTQSAIISRSQSLGPQTQKASLHRKASDPNQATPMPTSNAAQLRSIYATKTHQRRLSTSRTSRNSTDSDQSTDKNGPILMSQSTVNLSKRDSAIKKRRPFSFSSDYKDQASTSNPIGDSKELEVHSITKISNKGNRQQSHSGFESRHGNHVQFADLRNGSIDTETEMVEPEKYLVDQTVPTPDVHSPNKLKKHTPFNDYPNDIFLDWKRDYQVELVKLSPLQQLLESSKPDLLNKNSSEESNSKPTRDETIIARTDDLIKEVAKFITEIKSSRTENFHTPLNSSDREDKDINEQDFNTSDSNQFRNFSSSFESVDGLSSITCPSIVLNQSGRSTFRDKAGQDDDSLFSRPASASLRKSFSNDDIHGRISLTLRLIEQEEKREMMKTSPEYDHIKERIPSSRSESFLPSVSNPASRPPSRSSYSSPIPSEASARNFNLASPKLPNPNIDSLVGNPDNLTPRSCSGYSDHYLTYHPKSIKNHEAQDSGLSLPQPHYEPQEQNYANQPILPRGGPSETERPKSAADPLWETSHEKTQKIFTFLDEVERSDRETLFGLKYDPTIVNNSDDSCIFRHEGIAKSGITLKSDLLALKTMDSLIRKGPVELAREQILLDRKLEESQYRIRVLEDTLIQQRELNMRNLRNSEKDLKKRLNLQKEEFDLAFSRNEALINEMAAEKRILQERCDKLLKSFDENVEKYKEQIRSLQQKHLDEIKRLRKAQLNAENVRKQQWVGNKTQEIREMTVKGLEPEVQRIIQRHQQEMSEVRAWHSDEMRETEERYQRKMNMQMQDLREKFAIELEDMITREKETASKKLESEVRQREDEFEIQKRKLTNDLYEERERVAFEEIKWKELMQENIRKLQIKGEIESENLKQEYETKIVNLERKHENELKSLKDIHEVEKESWIGNYEKKCDRALKNREVQVSEALQIDMEKKFREREKKLKDEFEKTRKEDEEMVEARNKRIQEKLQMDLLEMDKSEKDLKAKFTQAKSELISLEEQVFSLKTSLNLKDKQNSDLQESNLKMVEERNNLTSVIRREFGSQIEFLEDEVRSMKSMLVEIETKHKLELEQRQLDIEKVNQEKDVEIEKIGVRVKHAVCRKEETIQELQKQLDKANFQIQHLEGLIEQQRQDFLQSMTSSMVGGKRK